MMKVDQFKVLTRSDPFRGGTDILITKGDAHVTDIVFVDDGNLVAREPTLSGEDGEMFLRACLNAAWEAGMRPDGYHDVRENMKATDKHLQDMRAIAFGKLGVEKPA